MTLTRRLRARHRLHLRRRGLEVGVRVVAWGLGLAALASLVGVAAFLLAPLMLLALRPLRSEAVPDPSGLLGTALAVEAGRAVGDRALQDVVVARALARPLPEVTPLRLPRGALGVAVASLMLLGAGTVDLQVPEDASASDRVAPDALTALRTGRGEGGTASVGAAGSGSAGGSATTARGEGGRGGGEGDGAAATAGRAGEGDGASELQGRGGNAPSIGAPGFEASPREEGRPLPASGALAGHSTAAAAEAMDVVGAGEGADAREPAPEEDLLDGGEPTRKPSSRGLDGGPTKGRGGARASVVDGTSGDSADGAGGAAIPGAGGINDAAASSPLSWARVDLPPPDLAEERITGLWRASPEGAIRRVEEAMIGQRSTVGYAELHAWYTSIAEARTMRAEVPLSRRDYVRRYFLAIGPEQEEP